MTATEVRPATRPSAGGEPEVPGGPRIRPLIRRGRFWVGVGGAVAVALVLALVILGSGASGGAALGPTNAGQSGAKALVQVLKQQGVDVVTTSTIAETKRAAAAAAPAGDVTVLVYDSGPYLTSTTWPTIGKLGTHTIVVGADQTALDALVPGTTLGSSDLSGTLAPKCDLPALAASKQVTGDGQRYTSDATGALKCLPATSGGGYGLVQVTRASPGTGAPHTTTVVGTSTALTNAAVNDHDDAAFALRLTGDSPTLIWYLPSVSDLPADTGTLASLTPGWVTPSIALLAFAALAGAIWRGRRLGPLVVENLPVIVRSTETMEGRARLYERNGSRRHALDQVRIGTLGRLAGLLGLARSASVDEVVNRAAGLLHDDPRRLRALLVDLDPGDDRMLVRLSDDLRDLEAAVSRAVRSS